MDLTNIITPKAIAAYWSETASNRIPYLGEALFTPDRKAGIDLSWFKGAGSLPISLMPSVFDAKATFRDRLPMEKVVTEMPFFREGIKISEKDRQMLLTAQNANDQYANEILRRIFDDAANLVAGANVVAERMRMQLLFSAGGQPGIAIKANGVDYTYDYDPNGAWNSSNYVALTSTALWTASSTADPIANFETMKNKIADQTGAQVRYAIMNRYTFNLLSACTAVKNRYLSAGGIALGYLTEPDVKNLIRAATGIDIVIYDKKYKNESGTAAGFVPNGYVSFVPEGPVGKTFYGVTPEEADLLGSGQADVQVVANGVALTREVTVNPVNVNTFASAIVLPSFERMDDVGQLKVIT